MRRQRPALVLVAILTAGIPAAYLASGAATAQDVAPARDAEATAAIAAARESARRLAEHGDYDGAIDTLRRVQTRYGSDAGALVDEGGVYLRRASDERANGMDDTLVRALLADAMVRARKAMEADPECQGATLLLAESLRSDGDRDGARAALAAWIERHPSDARVRRTLGDLLFAARDWSGADLQYTRSLEVDPGDGLARLNQTEARQWMGIPAADIEKGYLAAARLLPDADRPLRLLVNLHPGDRAKKLELLGQVVLENPNAAWARVWIAYILRKEEPADPARALRVLRDAERVAPDNPTVHVNLAEMLEESADVPGAVAEYTLAVEKGGVGEMAGASNALDRLLNLDRRGDEIPRQLRERAYHAVCAKNPAEGAYGNNAGLWFRDVGKDFEKSLEYYLLSVAARPDDQNFLNDTGLIYLFHLTDRKDRCLPFFEKVVRLVEKERQPPIRGYWDTLENLCKYWFEKGDYARTIEIAKKRLDPKATLDGRPYPSVAAAQWKRRAEQELAKPKK